MCIAVPGRILDTQEIGENRIGRVQFGEVTRQAYLNWVPDAQVGDFVLVHAGFAIDRVDEDEALRALDLLDRITGEG